MMTSLCGINLMSVVLSAGLLVTTMFSANLAIAQDESTANEKSAPGKEVLVYKKVGERELNIHVSKPVGWKATDKRPAVLFFHGGGWTGGSPGQFDEHCKHLIGRGLVCFQVQYRLLKKPVKAKGKKKADDQSAKKETAVQTFDSKAPPTVCINDAKSAMRFVRSRSGEFGIDPDRIASGGGSAGGHLAAFLGTTDGTDDPADDLTVSARSNAMLLFNPVYNNGPGGWGASRVRDRYQEFSPAHNISSDDAPSIVFLGSQDKLIPVATAQKFQNEMKAAGVQSELRLYAGAGHGFFNANKENGKYYRLNIVEVDKFLDGLGWTK